MAESSHAEVRTEIEGNLSILSQPDGVVEIRAPKAQKSDRSRPATASGYFSNLEDMTEAALELDGKAPGVYAMFNTVDPRLLARYQNRIEWYAQHTTSDSDVIRYRWLPVDFDPVRPSGISSTDEEKEGAIARAESVARWLRDVLGWPEPILADSGNGAHLLFRVDIPNNKENARLLRRVLVALSLEFSDEKVLVDTHTYNPARLMKVYGTRSKKGDPTPDRPHRRSRVLQVPMQISVVKRDCLEDLVRKTPTSEMATAACASAMDGKSFDVRSFLDRHAIKVSREKPWEDGTLYELAECPFNSEHSRTARIVQFKNGALSFGCFHQSCDGNDWRALRDRFEPREVHEERTTSGHVQGEERHDPCGPEQPHDEDDHMAPQSVWLIRAAQREGELWRTPAGKVFHSRTVDGHREHWPLRSGGTRRWLYRHFFEAHGKPPGSQAVEDALRTLDALAFEDGGRVDDAHLRIAYHGGNVYVDLCNAAWQAVEITQSGWAIVDNPPVRFRRTEGALPLPKPERGGSVDELRPLLNIPDDDAWRMFVGWMLGVLAPKGPYPILVLLGEHGSAKTSQAKILRYILDPAAVDVRALPRSDHDLHIAAENARILCLDNISRLPVWLSDGLCRLSTGAGQATRTLYTDDEETPFYASRPVILNGIVGVAERDDLRDRCLFVELPPIQDMQRLRERELWEKVDQVRPRVLGAVFDAVAMALRRRDEVSLAELPRMADWAEWVTAAEPALGWPEGAFLDAYRENRQTAIEIAAGDDPVLTALLLFCEQHEVWEGTPSELHAGLGDLVGDRVVRSKQWPGGAGWMSRRLANASVALRALNIRIEQRRSGSKRFLRVTRERKQSGVPGVSKGREPETGREHARDAAPLSEASWKEPGTTKGHDDADTAVTPEGRRVVRGSIDNGRGVRPSCDANDGIAHSTSAGDEALCCDCVHNIEGICERGSIPRKETVKELMCDDREVIPF